jgi:protein TonB
VTEAHPAGRMAGRARIVDVVFDATGRTRRIRVAGALAGAGLLHVALLAFGVARMRWNEGDVAPPVPTETDVELAPPPPPPPPAPEPSPPPPPPDERDAPPIPTAAHAPKDTAPPAPAAPAAAGAILALADDPDAPVDLTGDTFVSGTASAYAGGFTRTDGTSITPVRDLPPSTAAPSTAAPGPPPGPDRSTPVSLPEEDWSCPWPAGADAARIDEQTVLLEAVVRHDGKAESVKVLRDPGFGFGSAATACALAARFEPARDRAGRPIRAKSPPILVHFTR